jgi:hypothetical protein
MNRTETYRGTTTGVRRAKDADVVVGNGLAFLMVCAAITLAVIGLLVGFEVLVEDNANPFEDGMLWMAAALTVGLGANAFRREHHVVDTDETRHTTGTAYTEHR